MSISATGTTTVSATFANDSVVSKYAAAASGRGGVFLCAVLLLACNGSPDIDTDGGAPSFTVHFAGCEYAGPGPVCAVKTDQTLRLIVRTAATVDVQPRKLVHEQVRIDNDTVRYGLTVTPGTKFVTVSGGSNRWTVQIVPSSFPQAYREARDHANGGRHQQARDALAEAGASLDPGLRADILATIAFSQGDMEAFQAHHRTALEQNRAAGRTSMSVRNAAALAWHAAEQGRHQDAHQWLQRAPKHPDMSLESRYLLGYDSGLQAFDAADVRRALAELDSAAQAARWLENKKFEYAAEAMLAAQLQRLGRFEESQNILLRWLDEPQEQSACTRVSLLINVAWLSLLQAESGQVIEDPSPLLAEAAALNHSCSSGASTEANLATNAALAHWHAGRFEEVANAIDALTDRADLPLRSIYWLEALRARLALQRGDVAAAIAIFERARSDESTQTPGARWSATVGLAHALTVAARHNEAIDTYDIADQQLQRDLSLVPTAEGLASFVAQRRLATQRHIELLLQLGRVDRALTVAQQARANALRSYVCASVPALDERTVERRLAIRESIRQTHIRIQRLQEERRRQPTDLALQTQREIERLQTAALAQLDALRDDCALAPPPASVATLGVDARVFVQQLIDHWVLFVARDKIVTTIRADCPSNAASRTQTSTEDCLRDQLWPHLSAGERVALSVDGKMLTADWHRSGPERTADPPAFSFSTGLGAVPNSTLSAPTSAVIVADPTGNLAQARHEAEAVAQLLRQRGLTDIRILTGVDAHADRVLTALATADLFHFAGHGYFRGRQGWDSALQLAAGTTLGPTDILALPSVPRFVILSGCETARTDKNPGVQAMGLAQAFIARGASDVVAPTRDVKDQDSRRLMQRLYAEWGAPEGVSTALMKSQYALAKEYPDGDWFAFRHVSF